jgi:TetR/AcrR family transcriptional regulator
MREKTAKKPVVLAAPPEESRRSREWRSRRQSILDIAEAIFSQKGYYDASMAEIAQAAEFGVGYLYRHFSDKGDLYLAVVERKFDALVETIKAAVLSGGTLQDRLSTLARVYFAFFEANRAFFRLFIEQGTGVPHELRHGHRERVFPKFLEMQQQVQTLMQSGLASGQLVGATAEELCSAYLGILHGFIGHWVHTDPDAALSRFASCSSQIFLQGSLPRT